MANTGGKMKNTIWISLMIAVAAVASSCGTTGYYSSSAFGDGIYYHPTKESRAKMVADNAEMHSTKAADENITVAEDEQGDLYVLKKGKNGETYASRLRKFDSPTYIYNYNYGPWADPWYNPWWGPGWGWFAPGFYIGASWAWGPWGPWGPWGYDPWYYDPWYYGPYYRPYVPVIITPAARGRDIALAGRGVVSSPYRGYGGGYGYSRTGTASQGFSGSGRVRPSYGSQGSTYYRSGSSSRTSGQRGPTTTIRHNSGSYNGSATRSGSGNAGYSRSSGSSYSGGSRSMGGGGGYSGGGYSGGSRSVGGGSRGGGSGAGRR